MKYKRYMKIINKNIDRLFTDYKFANFIFYHLKIIDIFDIFRYPLLERLFIGLSTCY